MTKVIPSTDLRNNYNEVSRYCLSTGEPVIVTRNGRNDLVIMSPLAFEHFEYDRIDKKIAHKFEEDFFKFFDLKRSVYEKIDKAIKEIEEGKMSSFDEIIGEMEGENVV